MDTEEFDSKFCSQLNSQQREAVHSVEGPILLLAVPGSGKTTVLVNRLGYMVHCCGIDPGSILTMTYTVAATKEMRERFAALFGSDFAKAMTFSTINSLSAKIVKFYAERHGSGRVFPVVQNDEATAIISQIYRKLHDEYPTDSTVKDISTGITYVKNMMLTIDEIKTVDTGVERFDEIYRQYCAELNKRKLMDFDDQMVYARKVLNQYPDVLEHFREQYRYICVDESQDTSKIQHDIIKLLAGKYNNIFMVGDEDQSIYGFRAAYPDALLNFETDYPNAKVLLMEKNYRSTPEIVAAADMFISRNQFRHPKTLQAMRNSGVQVQMIYVSDRMMQFAYLFEVAKSCGQETAILYRNNDSALPLIDLLERSGIPYACKQKEDAFFSHKIVVDVRDIITFAYEPTNCDIFMRIYYKLGSPISKSAAQFACEQSRKTGKPILDELLNSSELNKFGREAVHDLQMMLPELPKMTAEEAIRMIWSGVRYSRYVAERKLDAGKIDILMLLARREKSPTDFLRRLDELKYITSTHESPINCPLILSTVHSSKGLEYERVYLMDVFDGLLPSKPKKSVESPEDIRQYEEDRRMYYVAMTRAKNELYLFSCTSMDSEFTSELLCGLPRAVIDENDVFASLQANLLGKTYTDAEKGQGVICGQCGDTVLVVYRNRDAELLCMEQMLQKRDRTVQYAAATNRTKPSTTERGGKSNTASLYVSGKRVRHLKFGSGMILSVKGNQIEIQFGQPYGVKTLALNTVIQNNLIQLA